MARRNTNNKDVQDGVRIVLMFLFIGIIIVYFFIKWTIEIIIDIYHGICKFIEWRKKKKQEKIYEEEKIKKQGQDRINQQNKINQMSLSNQQKKIKENVISNPASNLTSIKEDKTIENYDMSIYDNLFESQIKRRGLIYYKQNRVNNLKNTDNRFTCNVSGSEDYKVSITFDKINKDKIVRTKCTCPYFQDSNNKCKHIYAALLQIKNNKLIEEQSSKNFENKSIINN